MKTLCALALVAVALVPLPARSGGVLVELFTSQGCSSCPPAESVLADLATRPDVVALALHVDYWDYLGWVDTFGQSAFTARQRAYRDAFGKRVIYTPQMVVQGTDDVLGADGAAVQAAIAAASAPGPALSIAESDGMLVADLVPGAVATPATILVAKYQRRVEVAIARGELAGRTMTYHNAVLSLDRIGPWDGTAPTQLMLPQPGRGEGIAVWLQDGANGPVLAAAKHER